MATNAEMRTACEADLFTFAKMMFPNRYFGDIHSEMFYFFQKSLEHSMETGEGSSDGALIPRDHQKSFCIAVAVAWAITKYPWFTVAYVSSNPKLADRQLTIIKNIFLSEDHRALWPEMLNFEKGRTGKLEHKPKSSWTQSEFSVDHPDRPKSEKDPTVTATSAKSTNTGAHVKLIVFDDLVTNENYESPVEREAVKSVYQSYNSIATTGSLMWAVGTRYGEDDLYASLKEIEYTVYPDPETEENPYTRKMWNFLEAVVEDSKNRDGTGNFLWPRQKWGKSWYGFDQTELSKKRANSFNLELFYAQYYNDPNAAAVDRISTSNFKYIDPRHLEHRNGVWTANGEELKLHAAMDLAFSEGLGVQKKKRDYTAIAVIGWDKQGYLYVLDVHRFQTDKVEVYYKNLMDLYDYWGFREATIETNAGGKVIVNFIQAELRKEGRSLVVTGNNQSSHSGSKTQRLEMILEPLYRNNSVYHVKGKYTRELEAELKLRRPPHDDLKDAVCIAVQHSKRPSSYSSNIKNNATKRSNVVQSQSRFLTRTRRVSA